MKTLKECGFKDEEIAQWREFPISRALIECLKGLRDEAEQQALSLMRGSFTDRDDRQARVFTGIGEGVNKAVYFIERGGK